MRTQPPLNESDSCENFSGGDDHEFSIWHVENDGRLLFEQILKMDLEEMVCKRKNSPYRVTEKPSRYWIRVKNPLQPSGRAGGIV
jgi:ATP-dependent DNA ligase